MHTYIFQNSKKDTIAIVSDSYGLALDLLLSYPDGSHFYFKRAVYNTDNRLTPIPNGISIDQ